MRLLAALVFLTVLCGTARAQYQDNFNRAPNESPLGGSWTNFTNYEFQLLNQKVQAVGNNNALAYYNGTIGLTAQSVAVTLATMTPGSSTAGILLRLTDEGNFYALQCSDASFGGSATLIWEMLNYQAYNLTNSASTCAQGDQITGSATGGTLTLKNGSTTMATIDDPDFASGACGMFVEYTGSTADTEIGGFVCNNLAAGVGVRHQVGVQ